MGAVPWVKFYAGDFLNGIADLDPHEIAVYIVVLARIYDEGAPIKDKVETIARRCNMRPTSCAKALDSLVEAGKLVRENGTITNRRAEKEIKSRAKVVEKSTQAAATRWEKQAENTKENNDTPHADALPTHRPGICQPEPEPELDKKERKQGGSLRESSASADPPVDPDHDAPGEPDEIAIAVGAYNLVAEQVGWPRVQKLTDARRRALRSRLRDGGGVEGWRIALAKARASPFLTGANDTGWRADFDFLVQAKSFTKLMEGAYDARRPRIDRNQPLKGPDALSSVFGLSPSSGDREAADDWDVGYLPPSDRH